MAAKIVSRRTFVEDASKAALAFTVVPRHVLGGRGFQVPSDTLNIACIGVGGMGRSDVRGVSSENIYALCDVDDKRAAISYSRFPRAKRYKDFRVMLEKEAEHIDAVTVSTPDHTHAVAAVMALKMRKPVFCQKPLARTIGEVRAMVDAAKRAGVVTQMGNQGHARDGTRQLREWVEAGAIGTVREVHYWTDRPIWPQAIDRPLEDYHIPRHLAWDLWLGPAPQRPYNPAYAPFRWRGWWDFGTGALGDIACHSMDAAFWALDLEYPEYIEAESTTPFPEAAPKVSRIVYRFAAKGERGPITVVWRDGSLGPLRPAEVPDYVVWPASGIGGQLWIGDDGELVADVYGDDVRLLNPKRHEEFAANPPPEKYPRSPGVYDEWIRASKGGEPAGSTFDGYAGPLTEMVLLGNLALRSGRPLEIDTGTGKVTNVTVPEEYLRPTYREGWSL